MKQEIKFKQTEIGMIPEDWRLGEFSALFKVPLRNGLTRPTKVRGTGTKMVNMGELFAYDRINNISMERVPVSDKEKKNSLLFTGDLIFARQSLVRSGVGKCSIFLGDEEEVTFEGHLIRVRLSEDYSPMFYFYFFKSEKGKSIIQGFSEQVAASGIRGSDLAKIPVPIPPLSEQQSIARILSDLDSKIELNQQMNKTLEAIGKAIFKHWFIDFEFPNEEGKPYKSNGGEMVYNEELEKEIPKGWKLKTINDVVTVKGGSTPSTENPEYWENGKIYWCTPKDLSKLNSLVLLDTERKITESGLSTISSELLPAGTVLLSSRAPIGYLAISEIPVSINQGFIAIVCNRELSKYFMLFWSQQNMDKIKSRAHGTTFEEINKASFRNISILVPPPDILNDYDKLIHAMYYKIVKNEKETNILSHLRDSLLPKLMSGKIRVPVGVK